MLFNVFSHLMCLLDLHFVVSNEPCGEKIRFFFRNSKTRISFGQADRPFVFRCFDSVIPLASEFQG